MGNEGNAPDFDLKMPSLDLDLPEPTLNMGNFDSSSALNLGDLNLDAPLDLPGSAPGESGTTAADGSAGKKSGKKAGKKEPEKAPKAPRMKIDRPKRSRSPGLPAGALIPVMLNVLSIGILLVLAGIMYVFEVPVNAVPDLTLTTYVQSIWLVIGCLFVVAMLQDFKTALILTGIDLVMLATVFPTLWLLLDTPMNPMYFFAIGMIVLLALVSLPLNLAKARKPASGKQAAAGAAAPAPTGPRTVS